MDDAGIPEIDVTEAKRRMDEGVLVLDVREEYEYAEVRVPGSRLMPMSTFTARFRDLPEDEPLAVLCRSGNRSARVTQFLREQGYDAVNVAGGILAWRNAELPVEEGAEGGRGTE